MCTTTEYISLLLIDEQQQQQKAKKEQYKKEKKEEEAKKKRSLFNACDKRVRRYSCNITVYVCISISRIQSNPVENSTSELAQSRATVGRLYSESCHSNA